MILRFLKKVDTRNSITIPKKYVEIFGREFYMEIHKDKIVLIPIKKGK